MSEPLTDEEFEALKKEAHYGPSIDEWYRLIATVDSLKQAAYGQAAWWGAECTKLQKENAKLKTELDAALKHIEERREDDQTRNG